jgi:hypothetical protein
MNLSGFGAAVTKNMQLQALANAINAKKYRNAERLQIPI